MNINNIIALEDQANPFNMTSLPTIGMLVVVVIVFYFVIIRPRRKQDKETTAMRNSLRIGDEITTIGGIIGKIVSIKDPTCVIETGRDGTRIRILKSAIKSVDVPAAAMIVEDNADETPADDVTDATDATTEDNKNDKKKDKKKKK